MSLICSSDGFGVLDCGKDGFRIVYAVVDAGEVIYEKEDLPIFNSWRDLVGLFTEVALVRGRVDSLKEASALLLPAELQNPAKWLVSIGDQLPRTHDDEWERLAARCDDNFVEGMYPQISAKRIELVEQQNGLYFFSREQEVVNPFLTASELYTLVILILSDQRTEQCCPDQYSPFLAVNIQGVSRVAVKTGVTVVAKESTTVKPAPVDRKAYYRDIASGENLTERFQTRVKKIFAEHGF